MCTTGWDPSATPRVSCSSEEERACALSFSLHLLASGRTLGVLCVVCLVFFPGSSSNCSSSWSGLEENCSAAGCNRRHRVWGVPDPCRGHSSRRHFVMTEPISSLLHGHWECFVWCLFAFPDSSSNCGVVEQAEEKLQCNTECLVLPTFVKGAPPLFVIFS